MKSFWITIKGVPDRATANRFWHKIEKYNVHFTVLEKRCFIYGSAAPEVIDVLCELAKEFCYEVSVELE